MTNLQYWHLGRDPKKSSLIKESEISKDLSEFLDKTEHGVKELIKTFEIPETCYEVCPVASNNPKFNDYEHLARQQEWAHAEEEGETDGAE